MAWNIPIYNAVMKYSKSRPTPFHMPGHKLGKGIPAEFFKDMALLDLTEIPGTDNLHYPEGAIKEAQQLAAKAFHADKTYFLVNGSTTGVHAMILSICKPGDKLIVARDCHKAVVNGMLLCGVTPIYIKPSFNAIFGIPGAITPEAVKSALEEHPDAAGVLITRPNYYGICADIESIAAIVHSYGKILAVDEAHGAHLGFSVSLPEWALDSGADICVQSAHKTLPALTQSAYLHVKGPRIDVEKLEFYLSILQTSSPSYILMAYLDIARAIMQDNGADKLRDLLHNINGFKQAISKTGFEILEDRHIECGCLDKTRIVVNAKKLGGKGFDIDKSLREAFNLQVEMSDLFNIVCIATTADQKYDFDCLAKALINIADSFKENKVSADIYIRELKIPSAAIALKDIVHRKSKSIDIRNSAGSVSKVMVTPYPPGIPVICPGEIISEDAIAYVLDIIISGGVVNGLGNNMEICIVD